MGRLRLATASAVCCDHHVHIEQPMVIRTAHILRNKRVVRDTKTVVSRAEPLKISITRRHERPCSLQLKIIRDGAPRMIFTLGLGMPLDDREILRSIWINMTAKRVKPTHQGSIGVDFTPLRAKEHAGAVLLLA